MKYGNISGLVNGTEQVVYDHTVSGGAVSSIDTGSILNGDEDGVYTIFMFQKQTSGGGAYACLRFNSDSGSNYGRRHIVAENTTASDFSATAETVIYISLAGASQYAFSKHTVYAKSGSVRLVNGQWLGEASSSTVTRLHTAANVWNDTSSNITSAQIVTHTGASTFDNGTRVIILKQNNFSNGTPTGVINAPYIENSWKRVGSSGLLGSAQTSVTISSLDGDTDVIQRITGRFVAGDTPFQIRPNNDSTSGNYGYQILNANNTTVAAARSTSSGGIQVNYTGATAGNGNIWQFETFLFSLSGNIRLALTQVAGKISGTTVTEHSTFGSVWTDTSNNITSHVFGSGAANAVGAGSIFEVYGLRPNV